MIPRVLIDPGLEPDAKWSPSKEQRHYLIRVLRLRRGDPVQAFDGQGRRFEALLIDDSAEQACLQIGKQIQACPESRLSITLAQCLSSGDKMDWTIEKAVELGVGQIQPLISERSVVRLDDHRIQNRLDHWHRVIVSACMQCGRDRLPPIAMPVTLQRWIERRDRERSAILLWPDAQEPLSSLDIRGEAFDLLVGPESGLSAQEQAHCLDAGFQAARLGPRVLRTETAGLTAIAVLQARFGDL
ncbi:MAG: 16S rRNA (uracil(1498)-N(3))-methyltransferase [Quisquiliibacterium sp.]